MNFADLYRFANEESDGRNVGFRSLADCVIDRHPRIGGVETWRVNLDPTISIGYMLYEEERTSPYEPPFDVAVIRFHDALNRCWSRFVCCKELMHVFDGHNARTDTAAKFAILLAELESTPLLRDASDMFRAENDAIWMAMLVMCPERIRKVLIKSDNHSDEELMTIAQTIKLPVQVVRAISKPYYFAALETLTGDI